MKITAKKRISLLLVLCVLVSLVAGAITVNAASYPYYNNGAIGVTCTSLSEFAEDYYTGSYSFEVLSQQRGDTLKKSIADLVKSDRHTGNYGDLRQTFKRSDAVNGSSSKLRLFYCGLSADSAWDSGKTYNREHMWPDSLGGSACEGDLHSMRPTDPTLNSTRGNKPYGNVNGGKQAKASGTNQNALGGYYSSSYYEPLDAVKGDVARAILYDHVTYSSLSNLSIVFQSVDVLLEWIELDPVDEFEMSRNDVIEGIQGNRNPFVDYPELAFLIYSKTVPASMPTPSGGTGSVTPPAPVCTHSNTELRNASAASCTSDGYSGDTYCVDCGDQLSTGSKVGATGHVHTELRGKVESTCTSTGYTGDEYCTDCGTQLSTGRTAGKIAHSYTNGVCTACGKADPATTKPTESTESSTKPTEPAAKPTEPPQDDKDDGSTTVVFIIGGVIVAGAAAAVVILHNKK